MNAISEVKAEAKTGLELLREPFKANQISKLPKPTKAQTDAVRADLKKGIRCELCGAWHHKDVVHLDYVGHAALTDRLLDADPNWNWEPLAFTDKGTPLRDENGGLWIKLTVCGVTRYGYGNADGKTGGDAIKELIGDALRNAAMRFGAALDLWHKGDLHADDEAVADAAPGFNPRAAADRIIAKLRKAASLDDLSKTWADERETLADIKDQDPASYKSAESEKDSRKAALAPRISADLAGDEIPY
jgi:hypothetical protein